MSRPLEFGDKVWIDGDKDRLGVIAADAVAEDGARFIAFPSGYQQWIRADRLVWSGLKTEGGS